MTGRQLRARPQDHGVSERSRGRAQGGKPGAVSGFHSRLVGRGSDDAAAPIRGVATGCRRCEILRRLCLEQRAIGQHRQGRLRDRLNRLAGNGSVTSLVLVIDGLDVSWRAQAVRDE